MDPQQRQLLERGYTALHEAGMTKATLMGSVTAANVGQWQSEFGFVVARTPAASSVYAATGYHCSVTCGRISFSLGLQGPCASYDTACSAGLVATHAASSALVLGECASSLSAGINLMLLPAACVGCAVAGMTSALGRCHTFDGRADGYARSEACCAFVLCRGRATSRRMMGLYFTAVRCGKTGAPQA